jgi:F420-0:gamma-glutamyl ligase-like protein
MNKYCALAISTNYWKPGDNYLLNTVLPLKGRIQNGDFIVVSEKALSIATCKNAEIIASFWMRFIWGYPLGIICGFGQRLLFRLRNYPLKEGSRHKQTVLEYSGLLQALLFGSEGGIDGSNLAFSFVSLPLDNAESMASKIRNEISQRLLKDVCVIIADTDKTYKFRNFFFTSRTKPLKGITSFGGVVAYVFGRLLKLKRSSTPLAVVGSNLTTGEALKITNIADKTRGPGSGATVWDMAARFQVDLSDVSWKMLSTIKHKPIVIVRQVH